MSAAIGGANVNYLMMLCTTKTMNLETELLVINFLFSKRAILIKLTILWRKLLHRKPNNQKSRNLALFKTIEEENGGFKQLNEAIKRKIQESADAEQNYLILERNARNK
jgi:hypothetical protein